MKTDREKQLEAALEEIIRLYKEDTRPAMALAAAMKDVAMKALSK
jgi:hypothetical protein